MPPIIMFTVAIIYCMTNLFNGGSKGRRFIEKALPWLFLLFIVVGVGIQMNADGELTGTSKAIYDYVIDESAFTIIMLVITSIMRMFRKKKRFDDIQAQPLLTETEEKLKKLPDTEAGRSNIVRKFSEKYNLNLTTLQIKSIVDGSFLSEKWALEIWAMDQKYAVASEWYAGDTDWLRAYLKAFNVQNVSADFDVQRDYCKVNFKEVLTAIDVRQFSDIQSYINQINNTFMTNFDEVTFMVAYRFLLKSGVRVDLPKADVVRVENEVDALARKYDNLGTADKLQR